MDKQQLLISSFVISAAAATINFMLSAVNASVADKILDIKVQEVVNDTLKNKGLL